MTIQRKYQPIRCLAMLQECLSDALCVGGIRALTRYHLCLLYFHSDIGACARECQELVNEFIGSYHMLLSSTDRSPAEEEELWLLQYLLYYCLLMLGYLRRS